MRRGGGESSLGPRACSGNCGGGLVSVANEKVASFLAAAIESEGGFVEITLKDSQVTTDSVGGALAYFEFRVRSKKFRTWRVTLYIESGRELRRINCGPGP